MDDEIKNIPELEKALEEQVTGEVEVAPPVEEASKLDVATKALDDLVGIKDTIIAEGVSQEDIRSVFTIIQRLNDAGIEVGLSSSMEEYGLGHYTPNRTIVNQQVSLEGIGATILNVIKAVFEKLVSFVAGIVRYFRTLASKDKAVEASVERAIKKIKAVREQVNEWKRLSSVPYDQIERDAIKYGASLINDGPLPRNRVSLAALCHPGPIKEIKEIHTIIENAVRRLRFSVKCLKDVMSGKSDSLIYYEDDIQDIINLRHRIGDMLVESPDRNYFTKADIRQSTADAFIFASDKIETESRPLVQYEYILKAYFSVADMLREIRKVDFDTDNDDLVRLINNYLNQTNQAFEVLGEAVDFFAKAKSTQTKVLSLQMQFLNRYASLLVLHVRDTALTEGVRNKVDEGFNTLQKKLKTFGV